jgi:hypothetical protein
LNLSGLFEKLCRHQSLKEEVKKHRQKSLEKLTAQFEKQLDENFNTIFKHITAQMIGHFRVDLVLAGTDIPIAFLDLRQVRAAWSATLIQWKRFVTMNLNADILESMDIDALRATTFGFMKSFQFCDVLIADSVIWRMDPIKEIDHILFHFSMNQLRLEYSDNFQKVSIQKHTYTHS